MVDFTVAICTYNGEARLPKVLECVRISCGNAIPTPSSLEGSASHCDADLRSDFIFIANKADIASHVASATLTRKSLTQATPSEASVQETRSLSAVSREHFSWEVIVIDNNSTDNTAKVVQEYQANWSNDYPLRYYFEPVQGVAFARRRAIKEAKGSLVGFLDDDNLPTPNWVNAAYSFGYLHPKAGAYGSQVHGEYEIEPPKNFKRIACFLAIIERGQNPFRYELHNGLLPVGAGLVIRKQAWLDHVPERPFFKGVSGTSLLSKGEDLETLSYISKAGWEIWYNPHMQIYHQIPQWRLEKKYLVKLLRGIGLSRYPIRMLRFQAWQRPFIVLAYLINDLKKLILHFIRYSNVLDTDIIAACEMELLIFSFISPFYHWKRWVRRENKV